MTPYAFLLPLVSVLVGLAVTDVARSVHVLLRARSRVQWDALPLAAAFLAVLTTYNLWWRVAGSGDLGPYLTLGGFLPLAAQLLVLFLLCASALPDAVPDAGLDLRAFYEGNARTFWTLFAVHVAILIAVRLVGFAGDDGVSVAKLTALNLASLALFVVLIVVRQRWVHVAATTALVALALAGWASLSLTPAALP